MKDLFTREANSVLPEASISLVFHSSRLIKDTTLRERSDFFFLLEITYLELTIPYTPDVIQTKVRLEFL